MTNEELALQLQDIQQKLDWITDQLKEQERHRREIQELKDDLNRIAADVFQTAVVELDEVAYHFDSKDLLFLLKKLLRNVRRLTRVLDQLESLDDFVRDAAPITKAAFLELLETLDEFDRKGYFQFFGELIKIVDRIVTAFTVEDVRHLGENIVTILQTVKNLTQPDMLMAVNNAVSVYKNLDIEIEGDVTFWQLMKELKSPELRRGLAFGIQFLKNIARPEILPARNNGNGKKELEEVQNAV